MIFSEKRAGKMDFSVLGVRLEVEKIGFGDKIGRLEIMN